jgi:hypothetical protein
VCPAEIIPEHRVNTTPKRYRYVNLLCETCRESGGIVPHILNFGIGGSQAAAAPEDGSNSTKCQYHYNNLYFYFRESPTSQYGGHYRNSVLSYVLDSTGIG